LSNFIASSLYGFRTSNVLHAPTVPFSNPWRLGEGIMGERTWWETIKVESAQLVNKVEELIKQGNVRRIVIKRHDRTIVEFPLTVGVVGAVVAPILAAGAIAALVTDCTIAVERVHKK